MVYRLGLYHWEVFNPSTDFVSAHYEGKEYRFHVYGLNSLKKAQLPKQCLAINILNAGREAREFLGYAYPVDDYYIFPKPESLHNLSRQANNADFSQYYKAPNFPFIQIAPNGFFGSTGPNTVHMEEAGIILINQVISKIKKQYGYSHICTYGTSVSAQIIAGLLTKREDIACAYMLATPYNRQRLLSNLGEDSIKAKIFNKIKLYNAVDHANEINIFPEQEIVLIHDSDDEIVPINNSHDMYKALKKIGANVTLLEEKSQDDLFHHGYNPFYKLGPFSECSMAVGGRVTSDHDKSP